MNDWGVDLPEVDGIPIPPYGIPSQPSQPLTDKDMENGLKLLFWAGVTFLILLGIAVILSHYQVHIL